MKDIKIEVPEGYKIDSETSTFEHIKFKKLHILPSAWADLSTVVGEYITHMSLVVPITGTGGNDYHRNVVPTEIGGKAILSLIQLLQLRQAYRNSYEVNWKPNWDSNEYKYCVSYDCKWKVLLFVSTHNVFSFQTKDLAETFLSNFEDNLLNDVIPLFS